MVRILIVEDDSDKLKKIMQLLLKINGISENSIEFVLDTKTAKEKMRQYQYDFIILDISLPERLSENIQKHAGLELLREMHTRDVYKMPIHILGVTQFPEIHEEIKEEFSRMALTLVNYDLSSVDWEDKLVTALNRLIKSKIHFITSDPEARSFLAIICAVRTPELDALLLNGWKWERISVVNDDSIYYRTEIGSELDKKIIYACCAERMGMPASAVIATKTINNFKPRYIAMCGITAGYPKVTKLGDIIVADPVWDYGSGKWTLNENNEVFLQEPHQINLDVGLKSKFIELQSNHDLLNRIRKEFNGNSPDYDLRIHIGPLASGAAVIANETVAKQVQKQNRKVLGIEMESYAVYLACQEALHQRPKAFSIKSVVDFANGEKNDACHKYSAFVSAHALKAFTEDYLE